MQRAVIPAICATLMLTAASAASPLDDALALSKKSGAPVFVYAGSKT